MKLLQQLMLLAVIATPFSSAVKEGVMGSKDDDKLAEKRPEDNEKQEEEAWSIYHLPSKRR